MVTRGKSSASEPGRLTLPDSVESHELPLFRIPQFERRRAKALPERQYRDVTELRHRFVRRPQPVVGNARIDMMHMMPANAPREPLEHTRQPIERAAMHRRRYIIPLFVVIPVCVLVLMLHVEQPDARQ